MRVGKALVALVVASGCSRPLNGPLESVDAELDQADAQAFLQRWHALANQKTKDSAVRRANLALEALESGQAERLPGLTAEQLEASGRADAEHAAQKSPDDPAAWRVLALYQFREGGAAAAAQAACKAADLAPRSADDQESCGDMLGEEGDAVGAVTRYKAAFVASTDREQQFELIERIGATSLTPATDVESLPPEVLAQYRQAQEQARREEPRLEPPHQGTAGGPAFGRPIRLEPPRPPPRPGGY